MKRFHPDDGLEDDAAHIPIIYPIVASLLALWLAFWGPAKPPVVRFQNEWRIPSSFERPNLALPIGNSHLLIAADMSVKLLATPELPSKRASFPHAHENDKSNVGEELSRTSLLGKTRVSKGRRAKIGTAWDNGAVIVTEVGVAVGLEIADGKTVVAWETSFENQDIEAVSVSKVNGQTSEMHHLLLFLSKEQNSTDPSLRTISALDCKSGSVIWRTPFNSKWITAKLSGMVDDRLEPHPIHHGELGFVFPELNMVVVRWSDGAILVDMNQQGKIVAGQLLPVTGDNDHPIQIDIDGDGSPETLYVKYGKSGCMTIAAHSRGTRRPVMKYDNCQEWNEGAWLALDSLHAVVVSREIVRAGASVLLGNVTLNRLEGRGFDLILFQPGTSIVTRISPNKGVRWSSKTVSYDAGDTRVRQRLLVLRYPNFDMESEQEFEAYGYGSELSSHVLVIGARDVMILRVSDGLVTSTMQFSSQIIADPLIRNGRAVFLLESGEIVSASVKLYRDIVPPVVLIPVMILLCSLWACVMWRRLEDI